MAYNKTEGWKLPSSSIISCKLSTLFLAHKTFLFNLNWSVNRLDSLFSSAVKRRKRENKWKITKTWKRRGKIKMMNKESKEWKQENEKSLHFNTHEHSGREKFVGVGEALWSWIDQSENWWVETNEPKEKKKWKCSQKKTGISLSFKTVGLSHCHYSLWLIHFN